MASVLIVDDDRHIRDLLCTYIGSLGHRADSVADAAAALAALERQAFDVVFTDVCLEGTSGLALLREIRNRCPKTAVVLMTAYATVPQAVEAMRAGAHDYLMKPFAPDDVRLLINHILDLQAREPGNGVAHNGAPIAPVENAPSLKELERRRIEQVLAVTPTLEVAARQLGINPTTLWRKRKRYGIA